MLVVNYAMKAALVWAGLGFLLSLVGTATSYWFTATISGETFHFGLFSCDNSGPGTDCQDMSEGPQKLEILGLVASAMGLGCMAWFVTRGDGLLSMFGGRICMLGGTLCLIGVVIFGVEFDTESLGWSFALATVGGVCVTVAGALAYFKGDVQSSTYQSI